MPSVLFMFVNLAIDIIAVISKLMSVTTPRNVGDWRSLMRDCSVTFDHFNCFIFSRLVRARS
jgi:hypothetical protein